MKNLSTLTTLSTLLILLSTSLTFNNIYLFAGDKTKQVGEIDFRLGELSKKNSSTKDWNEIDEEDPVFYGDTIRTGTESKCEIKLIEGSTIRMSEKALYVFEKGADDFGKILHGTIWTNVKKRDKGQRDFQIKTPIAVAAVIGTRFRISYDGNISVIAVLDGKVNVDLLDEKKDELKEIEKKVQNKDKSSEVKDNNDKKESKSAVKGLMKKQKKNRYLLKAPKEIPGPYEVTLSEWISIVKGEVISVRQDGKYNKFKTDVKQLELEWESFLNSKE